MEIPDRPVTNQIADGAKALAYDVENRLTTHVNGAATTGYAYDGAGKRTSRSSNGALDTRYSWDQVGGLAELAVERNGAGVLIRRYVQGPLGPLALQTSAGSFSYHTDPIGSVRTLTIGAGAARSGV